MDSTSNKFLCSKLYYTLDEVQILRHQFFAVFHDEDTTNVEFDGVLVLLVLEQIERSTLWNEQKSTKNNVCLCFVLKFKCKF